MSTSALAELYSRSLQPRDAETVAFNNAGHNNLEDGQRLLLWHGSRVTNFAGILRQGLRIAPPEGKSRFTRRPLFLAPSSLLSLSLFKTLSLPLQYIAPSTGYMFGKGLYLADVRSFLSVVRVIERLTCRARWCQRFAGICSAYDVY